MEQEIDGYQEAMAGIDLAGAVEEHVAEHAFEVFCDVCGHWYDEEESCRLH